jgi:hypothetical protein
LTPCVRPCHGSRSYAARHLHLHRREGRGVGRSGVQITINTQSLRMFPDPILPYMFIYLLSRAERSRKVRHSYMKLLWGWYTCLSYTRSGSSQTTCINNPVPCSSSLLACLLRANSFPALRYITLLSRAVGKHDGCPTGPRC